MTQERIPRSVEAVVSPPEKEGMKPHTFAALTYLLEHAEQPFDKAGLIALYPKRKDEKNYTIPNIHPSLTAEITGLGIRIRQDKASERDHATMAAIHTFIQERDLAERYPDAPTDARRITRWIDERIYEKEPKVWPVVIRPADPVVVVPEVVTEEILLKDVEPLTSQDIDLVMGFFWVNRDTLAANGIGVLDKNIRERVLADIENSIYKRHELPQLRQKAFDKVVIRLLSQGRHPGDVRSKSIADFLAYMRTVATPEWIPALQGLLTSQEKVQGDQAGNGGLGRVRYARLDPIASEAMPSVVQSPQPRIRSIAEHPLYRKSEIVFVAEQPKKQAAQTHVVTTTKTVETVTTVTVEETVTTSMSDTSETTFVETLDIQANLAKIDGNSEDERITATVQLVQGLEVEGITYTSLLRNMGISTEYITGELIRKGWLRPRRRGEETFSPAEAALIMIAFRRDNQENPVRTIKEIGDLRSKIRETFTVSSKNQIR